jgi:hypothetical protein
MSDSRLPRRLPLKGVFEKWGRGDGVSSSVGRRAHGVRATFGAISARRRGLIGIERENNRLRAARLPGTIFTSQDGRRSSRQAARRFTARIGDLRPRGLSLQLESASRSPDTVKERDPNGGLEDRSRKVRMFIRRRPDAGLPQGSRGRAIYYHPAHAYNRDELMLALAGARKNYSLRCRSSPGERAQALGVPRRCRRR